MAAHFNPYYLSTTRFTKNTYLNESYTRVKIKKGAENRA